MTGSNLFSLLTARNLLPVVPVAVHAVATLANLTAFTMIKQARTWWQSVCEMGGLRRQPARLTDWPWTDHPDRLPPSLTFIPFQTLPVYLAFLLFELTVGMFYPSYGSIKSQSIPEEVRSGVMNIFRIPLNGPCLVVCRLLLL